MAYSVDQKVHFGPTIWREMKEESERKRQHFEGKATTRAWSRWRELRGIVAEETVARIIGIPRHGALTDGGIDFYKTDVKGVPPAKPLLSVCPTDKQGRPTRWTADYFVVVAVELHDRWAQVLGWALRDELRNAPIVPMKHAPAHVLAPDQLHPGLPQELLDYAELVRGTS